MASILSTFGIDWHLLLIQTVNFGLLLVGLTYFLYAPIGRIIEERRKKVAEGVEAAERAQAQLKEIEAGRAEKLAEAGTEADAIVTAARTAGAARERELIAQGEANVVQMLAEGKREAQDLKAKALAESKAEVAKLIVLGIEKAMQK